MSTIINLYGGPGTGKSTSAAYLYYLLKSQGKNVELVREYVKDWAWEGRIISAYDQFYMMGKQIRRESMLYGKVDYIVTDSPVLLSVYYTQTFHPGPIARGTREAALAFYEHGANQDHKHVHVMLNRSKEYNPAGRYQSEEESRQIDKGIVRLLNDEGFDYVKSETDHESLSEVLEAVQDKAI